jgi:hypothetical protein
MKKIIALCLIVCLSLSLSPFSSVATADKDECPGVAVQRRVQQPLAERAEQIAQEFYNHRCTAYEGGHFVEQSDERRAEVVARVKRYFENPENWEHIKRLDIEHFANEVMGESKIPRSSAARAELETFLRNQIIKLPDIEDQTPLAIPPEPVNSVEAQPPTELDGCPEWMEEKRRFQPEAEARPPAVGAPPAAQQILNEVLQDQMPAARPTLGEAIGDERPPEAAGGSIPALPGFDFNPSSPMRGRSPAALAAGAMPPPGGERSPAADAAEPPAGRPDARPPEPEAASPAGDDTEYDAEENSIRA